MLLRHEMVQRSVCSSPQKATMLPEIDVKIGGKVMWPQWVAGIGVTLLLLQPGIMGGWSSPYIAQLTAPESEIPITMTEASWVVSLLNLGRLSGAIIGSLGVNYLGSKTTILVTCMPMALCWVFTIAATSVDWLYISRFLGGIGLGMSYSSFSLYLGEIADPNIRGALVALGMAGLSIGNLVICILGAYLPMELSGVISLVLCVILIALFFWLPESPHHLVRIGQDDRAKASILWYHRGCDVEAEFMALRKFVENNGGLSFVETMREFRIPQIRKSLVLIIVLFMYSQMCGLNNILFYMETILRSAQVTAIDPALVVIIVMAFGVVGSFLSLFLIDRFGRKVLMITSCFGVSVALFLLGTEFQLLTFGFEPTILQGMSILAVLVLYVSVFIGILSVPSAVLSEIFPPHVKCLAACFGSISAGIFSFISSATYQPLINIMREEYVFFFYALLLVSAIPFTVIFVPETKGKSLQEIQNELMNKR